MCAIYVYRLFQTDSVYAPQLEHVFEIHEFRVMERGASSAGRITWEIPGLHYLFSWFVVIVCIVVNGMQEMW